MQKRHILYLIFFLLVSCTVSRNDYSQDYFTTDVTVNDSEFSTKTVTGEAFFTEGDMIGLIPMDQVSKGVSTSQLAITYTGTVSSVAHFTSGLGWSMMADGRYKYVAYFPYQENYLTTGIELDYTSQVQKGNDNSSHISAYDFLYSDSVLPESPVYAEFKMNHISALSKFTITVPEEYGDDEIKIMSIVADSAIFVRNGVCDISSMAESGKPTFTPESYSRILRMNFDSVNPDGNKKVVAYLMMAPAELSGETLTVKLWTKNNKCLSGTVECKENQEGGHEYEYSVSVSASGSPSLPDKPGEGETLDILLVGHSFGVDGTEYLPSLLDAAGIKNVNIGRFLESNCSLQKHLNYYVNDTQYFYLYCSGGNTTYSSSYRTLKSVIKEKPWDMVIFQQSIGYEGAADYDTYQPYLDSLVALVRMESIDCHGTAPFIGWHMFWAYGTGDYYTKMLDKIKNATKSMMDETGIEIIIPCATAVDNGRNTSLSEEIDGDGCHCSLGVGRYLGACTWFQTIIKPIYGVSVDGNTFRMPVKMSGECDAPDSRLFYPVNDTKAGILQRCAAAAAEKPFETTVITE